MSNTEALVAELISLAGGEIIGRVRLQKIFYIMDQFGLQSGFDYTYHHYGPFSSGLVDALTDAEAFGLVSESYRNRARDGVRYSLYRSNIAVGDRVGAIKADRAKRLIERLQQYSATILELAATIHWLSTVERIADWRSELIQRKGAKTENGRAEKALALLKELKLAPAI